MYLKKYIYMKTADSKKNCINDLKTMKSSSYREKRLLQIKVTLTDPRHVMNCVRNPIIFSNLTDRD